MEANAKSTNGGFKGGGSRVADGLARDQVPTLKRRRPETCKEASTNFLKQCQAAAQALSAEKNTQKAAEKKRKTKERVQKHRKKNAKKKGGSARKSIINQRKSGRKLQSTGGEPPSHAKSTDQNVSPAEGSESNNFSPGRSLSINSSNETNNGNVACPAQGCAQNPKSKCQCSWRKDNEKFDAEDEANVDLLLAKTPTNETVMRALILEINHRVKVWQEREMLNAAEKMLSKGIAIIHEFFDGEVDIKDHDLMTLYISRCQLRATMEKKKPSIDYTLLIKDDCEKALRHGVDQGPAFQNLFHQIEFYEGHADESPSCIFNRVKEKLLFDFAREIESRSEAEMGSGKTPMADTGDVSRVGNERSVLEKAEGSADNNNSNNSTYDEGGELYFRSSDRGDCELLKNEECTWSRFRGYCEDICCDNCRRHQTVTNWNDPYYFDFHEVCSLHIKAIHSPLKVVPSSQRLETSKLLNLCTECHKFLCPSTKQSVREKWNNTWPSFYWNLLTGKDMVCNRAFHATYGAGELWRFIPSSMRRFWLRSIKDVKLEGIQVYNEVNIDHPKSHFVDRTQDTIDYKNHIEAYTFEGMLRVMDPCRLNGRENEKSMILPDVLCPWGCSEFVFHCKELDPSILIQYHLRHAQLNLPNGAHNNMHHVETSRLDYLRNRESGVVDTVLLNPNWPVKPVMIFFPGIGPKVATCRNCDSNLKRKRLMCHPARKLKGNNLSSKTPDQLCQVRLQSRIVKPVCRKGMNTVPSLSMFTVSYAGADCATVSTDSRRFSNNGPKPVTFEHECLSMYRPDIDHHAHNLVKDGQISSSLLSEWMKGHTEMAKGNNLEDLTHYATFVPPSNAITLQKASAQDHKVLVELKTRGVNNPNQTTNVKLLLNRSWCASIYNMQVEDPTLYGWPMKAVNIAPKKWTNTTMLSWALLSLISSSKELYCILDQCKLGHSFKTPSGHLLTYIHHKIMKHCNGLRVKNSPFLPSMTQGQLCNVINQYLPNNLKDCNSTVDEYFGFGKQYLKCIFDNKLFPNVKVVNSLGHLNYKRLEGKDIVISVTKSKPTGIAQFTFGDEAVARNTFEARVILSMTVDLDHYNEHQHDKPKTKWKFSGTRHCRHGGGKHGFRNWWYQERSAKAKNIMTKVSTPTDENDSYPNLSSKATFYVVVFVRQEEIEVEDYKLDLHRSIGGQCTVFCNCNGRRNPLIVSGMMDQDRRKCMSVSCNKNENYMCPVKDCKTRLCFKCLESKSASQKPHVIAPTSEIVAEAPSQDGHIYCHDNSGNASDIEIAKAADATEANNEGDCGDSHDTDECHLESNEYDYGIPDDKDYDKGCNDDGDENLHVDELDKNDLYDELNLFDDTCRNHDRELLEENDMVLESNEGHINPIETFNDDEACDDASCQISNRQSNNELDRLKFNELFPIPENKEAEDGTPRTINFIGVPNGYYDDTDELHHDAENVMISKDVNDHLKSCKKQSDLIHQHPEVDCQLDKIKNLPKKRVIEDRTRLSAAGRHDGSNYALLDRYVSASPYFCAT